MGWIKVFWTQKYSTENFLRRKLLLFDVPAPPEANLKFFFSDNTLFSKYALFSGKGQKSRKDGGLGYWSNGIFFRNPPIKIYALSPPPPRGTQEGGGILQFAGLQSLQAGGRCCGCCNTTKSGYFLGRIPIGWRGCLCIVPAHNRPPLAQAVGFRSWPCLTQL